MKRCPHCLKPLNLKRCTVCGEEFTARRRNAEFCSARCKLRAHRKRKGAKDVTRPET